MLVVGSETTYNFSTVHYPSSLPAARIACSNNCSAGAFNGLTSFTIGFVSNAIDGLGAQPGFRNVAAGMHEDLVAAQALNAKGYGYAAADAAFLDYLNAYFFLSHSATTQSGLQTLHSISNTCSALYAPQMTSANYEYVIGGELRKGWAMYTLNNTIGTYNATAIDSDGVLRDLYSGGTANAWCAAASYMFNESATIGGAAVVPGNALAGIARARLSRAASYGPSIYLTTAQQAYSADNYPVAIFDADYAYSFGSPVNASAGSLLASAHAMAANATYGVWASQFANEAMMYYYDAGSGVNATAQRADAVSAYQTALLASQLSNDTRNVFESLAPTSTTTVAPAPTTASPQAVTASPTGIIYILLGLTIVLLVALLAALAYFASRPKRRPGRAGTKRQRKGRRARPRVRH